MSIFKKKNDPSATAAMPGAPVAPATPRPMQGGYEALARKVSRFQIAVAAMAAACVVLIGVCVAVNADATSRISSTFNGTTEIAVLNQTVPQGAQITADMVSKASIPNSQVVEGAIPADVLEHPEKYKDEESPIGKSAAGYLPKGTQISKSSVAWGENPSSLAASISDGMEAVSVSVDAQTGVSGMIHVGDAVRVIKPVENELGGEGISVVVKSARVAAVGANFQDGANEDYSCVTLELTPDDANAVKAAIADTGVTLSLISSADAGE